MLDIIDSKKEELSKNLSLNIDSIFVEKNGNLETKYYNEDKLHELRSCAKLLTAMAVGIAIDKKMLSLDTKVYPLIKNVCNITNIKNIDKIKEWTIKSLLTHQTGYDKQMFSEKYLLDIENLAYNEKMLVDEIAVLLKTYVNDEKNETPENNFTCPLTELLIVKKISKDKYVKEKPLISNLNELIVYYCILKQLQNKESINIEELLKGNDSASKLLNLDKILLNEYLETLKRKEFITVNRTAGLNMVYINKKVSLEEIFKIHFGKEHE